MWTTWGSLLFYLLKVFSLLLADLMIYPDDDLVIHPGIYSFSQAPSPTWAPHDALLQPFETTTLRQPLGLKQRHTTTFKGFEERYRDRHIDSHVQCTSWWSASICDDHDQAVKPCIVDSWPGYDISIAWWCWRLSILQYLRALREEWAVQKNVVFWLNLIRWRN